MQPLLDGRNAFRRIRQCASAQSGNKADDLSGAKGRTRFLWPYYLQPITLFIVLSRVANDLKTEYNLTRTDADRATTRMKAETQYAKAAGSLITLDELAATVPHLRHSMKV